MVFPDENNKCREELKNENESTFLILNYETTIFLCSIVNFVGICILLER